MHHHKKKRKKNFAISFLRNHIHSFLSRLFNIVDWSYQWHHLMHIRPHPEQVHATGGEPNNYETQFNCIGFGNIFSFLRKQRWDEDGCNHSKDPKHHSTGDDSRGEEPVRLDRR